MTTIANESVLKKYKAIGKVVNNVLQELINKLVPKGCINNICIEGNKILEKEFLTLNKQFKDCKTGVCFPICLSVNNCINHFSPLKDDPPKVLRKSDLVKIDFGAHLDGYCAVVAHTIIVGASSSNKVSGKAADVTLATYYAAEAACALMKPGTENYDITEMVGEVADYFKCTPIQGMLSFQLEKDKVDGDKNIIQNPTKFQRKEVEKVTFEENEVYGVDVIITTGKGISREMDGQITIYKKTNESYQLKLRTSREFHRKVTKLHPLFPFNLRDFEDVRKAKLGVKECVTHGIIEQFPVLCEKASELVAQFKYTVLLTSKGPKRITGLPFDISSFNSDISIDGAKFEKHVLDAQSQLEPKKEEKKLDEPEPMAVVEEPKAKSATEEEKMDES